jgi:hypothetical protein
MAALVRRSTTIKARNYTTPGDPYALLPKPECKRCMNSLLQVHGLLTGSRGGPVTGGNSVPDVRL